MQAQKIVHAITSLLFSAMMLASAIAYLTAAPPMVEALAHLGYPDYFRYFLGAAKLLGVVALWLPVPAILREWAYAGFHFVMIAAVFSHLSSGDGLAGAAPAAIAFLMILVSYLTRGERASQSLGSSIASL